MPLLTLEQVSMAFGYLPLFQDANLRIEPGERLALIGRNGSGKSTLLKVIAGEMPPDTGAVWQTPGLRIARLSQDVEELGEGTVRDEITGGLRPGGRDIWDVAHHVDVVLSRLSLPAERPLRDLSGGWKRRVLLGKALVSEPDLLLLDEPTNHLDIDAIEWLEEDLRAFAGALLFVTHDRAFLRRLATRIIELDRGALTSWPGSYDEYVRKKTAALDTEARDLERLDKKLAEEEAWLRRGIKARRTRNEGRVRALIAMRAERAAYRAQPGTVRMSLDRAEASGRTVFELDNVSKAYPSTSLGAGPSTSLGAGPSTSLGAGPSTSLGAGPSTSLGAGPSTSLGAGPSTSLGPGGDVPVIRHLSTRIVRGDRVGLIGPNGSGKTTLLRLLVGEQAPDSGEVRRGARLEVAYFDQQREQLDPERTVAESVTDGDVVTVNGQSRHVLGYLADFLFPRERAKSPVRSLSGGERNRLMLARLFARPANVLVMDEPTNDLDIETLELLEELISGFDGTVLLVTHDRVFLDNVVTSTLAFEGEGRVVEYVGGYEDYLRQRPTFRLKPDATGAENPAPTPASDVGAGLSRPTNRRKKTYKEEREYEALPARIEALEHEQRRLQQEAASPEFYKSGADHIRAVLARIDEIHATLEDALARWVELEEIGR